MMTLSNLIAAVQRMGRDRDFLPECSTCGKKVEGISDDPLLPTSNRTLRIVFRCHGKFETVALSLDSASPFEDWPKRLFLRNWAGATIKPERPKVRRL